MRAGSLRHRITLQQPQTGTDEYGQPLEGWVDVATVWASVEPLSMTALKGATEMVAGGAEVARDYVEVKLRPREVETSWRFTYNGRNYDIFAVRLNNVGDTLVVLASIKTG